MKFNPKRIHMYDRLRFVLSLLLILVGLVAWSNRPDYVMANFPSHGDSFSYQAEVIEIGGRDEMCATLSQPDGYIFLSGVIDIASLSGQQGFFQSADNEDGIFFEYDPGENSLIRLGIHLADGTTARVRFDLLRRIGKFSFVIMINNSGDIRMISNGNDIFANAVAVAPNCSNWRIGSANGSAQFNGTITMSVSSGIGTSESNAEIDQYMRSYEESLPSTMYKWPLYSGILLIALGNPWKWRKR
jgi:hypothetical protein